MSTEDFIRTVVSCDVLDALSMLTSIVRAHNCTVVISMRIVGRL